MTQLERVLQKYNTEVNLLLKHEQNYHQKHKGQLYITRLQQLQKNINHYKHQLLSAGKSHLILECSFKKLRDNNILEDFKVFYTGITSDEAVFILKFEYLSATDINIRTIIPGNLKKV